MNHRMVGIVTLLHTLVFGVVTDPLFFKQAGVSYFLASPQSPSASGNSIRARLTVGRTDSGSISPGEVILVPWNYGTDCRPIAWLTPTPWTPPNRLAFYTGALRPRNSWIENLPTFDVFTAPFQPLWEGDDDRRGAEVYRKPYLTIHEFMDFYAVVPTDQELQNAKPVVRQRIDAWVSANPALAARFPANYGLSFIERALKQ